jgi:dihydroflavonol-4-reductase
MKIIVTGATGFVGAAVVRQLLARGHEIRALVRPHNDRRNIADLPLELVEGSLQDEASLKEAVRGCQGLFHVAADYRIWVPRPRDMYRANVIGTGLLMEAALRAGVEKIVYTSSVATLGFSKDGSPAHENTLVTESDMIGPYKHSKFLAETVVEKMTAENKLPAVIVNPSTPIGPRDVKPTPTGRIITDMVKGRMPAYLDTGLNIAHVDDVAAGHILAFEKGKIGEKYVLGGENLPLSAILGLIADAAGMKAPTVQLPRLALYPVALGMEMAARIGGFEPMLTLDSLRMAAHHMYFTSAKAEKELGYSHRPAAEAIRDALAWFRQNGYC